MAQPPGDHAASGARPTAQNYLRVIVDPEKTQSSEKTMIDIVAVHGLNPANTPNHAEKTWTKGDKMWLRDFLPQELPYARILLFSYNANVAFESSTAGVLEQAQNLLNQLWLKRRRNNAENRPLVFIAHSLGGIVVKRALVVAASSLRYRSIRLATYGIVFFATPHNGGEFVTMGKMVSRIVRAVVREPKNSFLEALEKGTLWNNTMTEDFRTQLEVYQVISYYETRPLPNVGIIVNKESATVGMGYDRELVISLDLDHSNICKFDSQDDDDYEQVSGNIIAMVENAVEQIALQPSGLSSPDASSAISPNPSTMSFHEDHLPASPPLLLPPQTDQPQGLGLLQPEPSLETLSLTESLDRRPESVAFSDSTEDLDRRHSNSTAMTSAPSITRNMTDLDKNARESPRLASSIKMNIKDTAGANFREAAAEGKKDLVKSMLEKGVPIDNSGVWDGYTALADAALHGQEAVVELLLNEGANPAFKCISSTRKFGSKENTPLSLAAGKGHLGCMKLLLGRHMYEVGELDGAYRAAKYKNRRDAMDLIKERGGGMY